MKRLVLVAFVVATGCAREEPPPVPSGPVDWSVSASSSAAEVEVGDDFTLTLTVTHPPGGELIAPSAAELEPFAVLETSREEPTPIETKLHFRLAAYQLPGELEVGALEVRYRDESGEMATLETAPVPITIVTSLTPDVTDIHDIKDPVALMVPRDWSLVFWLLLALLASLIAYLIYRKLRKEPVDALVPAWVPPPKPPHEEAEAALARLRNEKLIEKGEIAPFYTKLTDIMKRYAGRRFDVPYLERTTEEILADLSRAAGVDDSVAPLRDILVVADLVKFAKQMPGQQQATASFNAAFQLVQDTKPASRSAEPETVVEAPA